MRLLFFIAIIVFPCLVFSQFGVAFHQSNLPFLSINYEIKNRLRPEIRLGTDHYFDALSFEGVVNYDLLQREEYEFYTGLGIRTNGFTGLVIPVGLNVYPLATKQFGFHIELAPIIRYEHLMRGSWGIRYRFAKKE